MRFIWTVAGDDPDYGNCKAHGINGLFAPLFDSLTSYMYLTEFQARGFTAGLYLGHHWFPNLTALQLANKTADEYLRLTKSQGEGAPALKDVRLMLNLEEHDPVFVLAVITQVRKRLPKVGVSWSPEGMQGGWMSDAFVQGVLAQRVRVVPQAFIGNMARVESDQTLRDLLDRGFPASSISIFYDASQLGVNWDGYAFTEGRLPRII